MSRSRRGFFIVLEGIDGAGKTSIARRLVEELGAAGHEAVYTYEPFDSLFVKALKERYSGIRDPVLDALVYAADRIAHVKESIEPVLRRGGVVVCDRYYYSSVAYQGAVGADPAWVRVVNRYALEPDLAIYIDVRPETGVERRRGLSTRFPEYEALELLHRVRRLYLDMVARGELVAVDGERGFEEVYMDVKKLIHERLGLVF